MTFLYLIFSIVNISMISQNDLHEKQFLHYYIVLELFVYIFCFLCFY